MKKTPLSKIIPYQPGNSTGDMFHHEYFLFRLWVGQEWEFPSTPGKARLLSTCFYEPTRALLMSASVDCSPGVLPLIGPLIFCPSLSFPSLRCPNGKNHVWTTDWRGKTKSGSRWDYCHKQEEKGPIMTCSWVTREYRSSEKEPHKHAATNPIFSKYFPLHKPWTAWFYRIVWKRRENLSCPPLTWGFMAHHRKAIKRHEVTKGE